MTMDSSSAQPHHQEMSSETLESMLNSTKPQQEKKPIINRPSAAADQQSHKCPRCESTNTKFCYYNNYSLSQPRYFCKSCRRYWTKGGTLRNVPVGGGCRKTKRSPPSQSSKGSHDHHQPMTTIPTPIPSFHSPMSYECSNDIGFPMSGNPNMPLSELLGNFGANGTSFDSLRGAIVETPRGFHNVYYGMGDGINNLGMGIAGNQGMGLMGYEEFKEGESSRSGLWGFPWQSNGGDGNMGDWNGIGSSNWHGLLNTPLM